MSEFKIVVDYPHSPVKVWQALTDPALIPLWSATGRGGRPVGFDTKIGTKFQYIAKPLPGWDGIVRCEVTDCVEGTLLSYTWANAENEEPSVVTCRLEPSAEGARLTWEHTGFNGFGGALMCRLLRSVRKKMLTVGMPPVLREMEL